MLYAGGRGGGGGGGFAGGVGMKVFSTIFRDFEKYDQETVFPTLDGASNYWKKYREIEI